MKAGYLGLLALYWGAASAFHDTSPFFIFSTSTLPQSWSEDRSIVRTQEASRLALQAIAQCPSETYILVDQPGLNQKDLSGWLERSQLRRRITKADATVASAFTIPCVLGGMRQEDVLDHLVKACKATVVEVNPDIAFARDTRISPQVLKISFDPLPVEQGARDMLLADHDSFLSSVIRESSSGYTVVYSAAIPYTSRPQDAAPSYQMDEPYPSALHVDLKRDVEGHTKTSNTSKHNNLPLFETYQYLSPGLFMGIAVTLLLTSILYIAVSAIAGLQVSYFAFSKEMGPAAQKKQQQ